MIARLSGNPSFIAKTPPTHMDDPDPVRPRLKSVYAKANDLPLKLSESATFDLHGNW